MKLLIYEKLKKVVANIVDRLNITIKKQNNKGRKPKIDLVKGLTLALYLKQSTRTTKKSLFCDLKNLLSCSYKTFVVTLNKLSVYALKILFFLLKIGRKNAHIVKFTDSTNIPVCLNKNANKHKTMKHLADWGNSGHGFYFGLKMTLTRDFKGRILGIKFTSPKKNDREIFKEINKDLDGVFIADSGYTSKNLERSFYKEGKRIAIIKPRKNMKKLATPFEIFLYNTRFRIEFDFRNLKLFYGLITSLPRSINGYIANYIYALLSYVLA